MRLHKTLLTVSFMCLFISLAAGASAGDFDWIKDLDIQAQADLSGFKATLATRFKIGNAEVNAVLSNVPDPADAYMVLRLGEMSSRPTEYVIEQYKSGKNKGWGALAKSLGIKPGSREFEALKNGHDMPKDNSQDKNQGNNKGNNRGNNEEKRQGKKK